VDDTRRKRIGELLRIHRLRNGLSLDSLAADLEMKVETLVHLESGATKAQARTVKKVCEKLGISVDALVTAPPSPGECSDAVIERLVERVTTLHQSWGPQPSAIRPAEYLSMLGRELAILRGERGNGAALEMLVDQIRTFCVSSEIYFTQRAAEASQGGTFLYSCSSLIDAGLERYIADSGWMMLLRSMGQAKRQFAGTYLRVFFVTRGMFATDLALRTLAQVIKAHLSVGVSVALVDADDLDHQTELKRNMAWIAGKTLLHATDQRQWDLEFKTDPASLRRARDQHHHFQKIALAVFKSGDEPLLLRRLRAVFGGDRHVA